MSTIPGAKESMAYWRTERRSVWLRVEFEVRSGKFCCLRRKLAPNMKDLEKLGNKFRLCPENQDNSLKVLNPGNRLEVSHQTEGKKISPGHSFILIFWASISLLWNEDDRTYLKGYMRFKWAIRKKKELDECLAYIRSPIIPPDPSQVYSVIFLLVSDLS